MCRILSSFSSLAPDTGIHRDICILRYGMRLVGVFHVRYVVDDGDLEA